MGFTDEETEAQGGGLVCLKSLSQQGWHELDLTGVIASPSLAVILVPPVTSYCHRAGGVLSKVTLLEIGGARYSRYK